MKYLMAVIVVASLIRLGRCQELPPAPSLFLAGLVGPTVLGVKHIQAGRQWQALLDGQPPTESERY